PRPHREPRLRPDAAVDLKVPPVPARVDRDQVLPRDQELHHAREERLLLVPLLAPVTERERPVEPVDVRGLLLALELDRLDLAVSAEAPDVALCRAHERPEPREERDQRARPEAREARGDARAGRRRDRPREGGGERDRGERQRARRDERGEEEEKGDRVPLERERQVREERRRRLVHRLEEPAPERAEVDDRPAGEDPARELAVDAPEPARLPE